MQEIFFSLLNYQISIYILNSHDVEEVEFYDDADFVVENATQQQMNGFVNNAISERNFPQHQPSLPLMLNLQELQKLIEQNEQILNQEKLLKSEARISPLLVQSLLDEISAMRKSMQIIETEIEEFSSEKSQFSNDNTVNKVLNDQETPYHIVENKSPTVPLNNSNFEYTIEVLDINDIRRCDVDVFDSRMSFQDQIANIEVVQQLEVVQGKSRSRKSTFEMMQKILNPLISKNPLILLTSIFKKIRVCGVAISTAWLSERKPSI